MGRLARMPEIGEVPNPIDPRLRKNLDLDVRVVMTWDADMTDVDLWVTDATGAGAGSWLHVWVDPNGFC